MIQQKHMTNIQLRIKEKNNAIVKIIKWNKRAKHKQMQKEYSCSFILYAYIYFLASFTKFILLKIKTF